MYKNQYPDYPDLLADEAKAQLEDVWAAVDTSNPLWHAAVIAEFQRAVLTKEPIHPWVLGFLYEKFHYVLGGSAWDDAFELPGRSLPEDWNQLSLTERRDASLFIDVAREIEAGEKTTEAITKVANRNHTSFETARAAFYAWNKKVNWRPKVSKIGG